MENIYHVKTNVQPFHQLAERTQQLDVTRVGDIYQVIRELTRISFQAIQTKRAY